MSQAKIIDGIKSETACFYFIWTKTGRVPRFTHHTYAQAEKEAKRLALKSPGNKYIILKAQSKFSAVLENDAATSEIWKEAA